MPPKKSAAPVSESMTLTSHVCFATYAAAHAFNRFYKPLLEPLGLTYPQYLVLLILWENDNLTVKEIGRRLFLDSGTLTPLLKRLESADIVRRTRDARDERQVRISLTGKGWELRGRAMGIWHEVGCGTGLGVDELSALKDQLDRLRESLNAYPAGHPAG